MLQVSYTILLCCSVICNGAWGLEAQAAQTKDVVISKAAQGWSKVILVAGDGKTYPLKGATVKMDVNNC
jgi:hypothetical protein